MEEKKKENLKLGDVVGTISDVARVGFNALNARRVEASRELQLMRELQLIHDESRTIWTQVESDLELSEEYEYTISPITGKVRVVRKLSKREVERERPAKKELEEVGGEE